MNSPNSHVIEAHISLEHVLDQVERFVNLMKITKHNEEIADFKVDFDKPAKDVNGNIVYPMSIKIQRKEEV